jgi:glutamine amidotransferase
VIAVVDSGGANLTSVMHALERLNAEAELTADPEKISRAAKVLLPGVGAAGRAMALMRERGLVDCVTKLTQPVLGICLGMQLLFERSQEGPTPCLGLIHGQVNLFAAQEGLTVPQMGWNQVHASRRENRSRLLDGLPDGTNFYFVHSYRAELGPWTAAACDYGAPFTAVAEQGNFFGVQFHPERSGPAGARLLQNFLGM